MSIDVLEPARPRVAPVNAKLLFLEPSGRRPRLNFTYDAPAAEVSEIYAPRTVFIRNARGCGASLDVEGFALRQHKSAVRDFRDDAEAGSLGRDEAATLVAQATGAARVHVFDHTVRRGAADAARQPSTRVHNDYTPLSAHRRVGELLGDEAKTLLQRRFAFINVWRPIQRPALNWPLALCHAETVDLADLIATDIVYPDRRGEIYGVAYNPAQLWFYYPEMQLDETLLIKCYDSAERVAQFTPHTSFENPAAPADAPPRESIEFRTIAFFD